MAMWGSEYIIYAQMELKMDILKINATMDDIFGHWSAKFLCAHTLRIGTLSDGNLGPLIFINHGINQTSKDDWCAVLRVKEHQNRWSVLIMWG